MNDPLPIKTAIVTGATEGIGQATAWALAEAGHDVIVTDLATESLMETIAGIEARGKRALGLPLNLLEEGSINALMVTAEAAFGPIGVLVNNAGCTLNKPVIDVTWDEYDQVMDVNLKGSYFLAARMAARCIAAGRPGAIVSIASTPWADRYCGSFCLQHFQGRHCANDPRAGH